MLRGNALAALLQRAQAAMASMLHLSPAEGSAQQAADAPPAQGMGSDDVLLLLGMIELLVADVNRTAASQASLVSTLCTLHTSSCCHHSCSGRPVLCCVACLLSFCLPGC